MNKVWPLPGLPLPWLILSALVALPISLIYHGWWSLPSLGLDFEVPRDFLCFWVGAKAVLAGQGDHVFNPAAFIGLKKALAGGAFPRLYWLYPPHFLMFVTPFGLFGYVTGFAVWTVLSVGLWLAAVRLVLPGQPMLWFWAVLSPAVIWALPYGQNGLIFGAFAVLAYHYASDRPWLAGLFAALLTMKPQIAPLIAVVFLAQGNWRAILSGLIATAGLVAASLAVLGPEAWAEYLRVMATKGAMVTYTRTDVLHQQATLLAGLRQIGVALPVATVIHLLVAAVAVALAALLIRRGGKGARWLPAVIFLNMLLPPYTLAYDMIPLALALILLATPAAVAEGPEGGVTWPILSLCWLLPVLVVPLNSLGLPPGPPLILAGTVLSLWPQRRALIQGRY